MWPEPTTVQPYGCNKEPVSTVLYASFVSLIGNRTWACNLMLVTMSTFQLCVKFFFHRQGPHPFYRPKKDKLVQCVDPLCTSIRTLNSGQCELPSEQCDYEIAYADEGSSQGVLVKDVFTLPFANGSLLKTHLAFGYSYLHLNHLRLLPVLG